MYYYGGANTNSCCQNATYPSYGYQAYPYYGTNNNTSSYAIILVLFILLVIVIGCRWTH